MEFHNICRDGLPNKNGKYITINQWVGSAYISISNFATDLYKIDRYDFNLRKGKHGWYDYDSEYGYYELDGILAWAEMPEIPEEYK